MPTAPAILLVDANDGDLALAELMLNRSWPEARIVTASDPAGLADAAAAPHDAAVVASALSWARPADVLAMLRRRMPDAALVMLGEPRDFEGDGVALDGVVRKTGGGYLALPRVLGEALERRGAEPASRGFLASIDELPAPALATDADGRVTALNEAMRDLLGVRPDDDSVLTMDHLLDGDTARSTWRRLCAEPRRRAAVESIPVESADGRVLTLAFQALPAQLGGPAFIGVLESVEHTNGDPAVHPGGADQLAQELRDIAMVFSHDLKEPVQLIERLCRRLEERNEFGPGNPAAKWVQQILQCSTRTSDMLDSMLEYLAVSARDASPDLVDLNRCLEQALENLRAAIDEANAEVTADHLPSIAGDEYQILHLFQNLISNALKFRGRDRLRLRIGVEADGPHWHIAFRDNGIGIAEAHLARVFEMGQRLHTHDEYPGTGVGLAICRRIVERHGGRIWVETNEGPGCTFFVALPQTPSHVTRLA